uniref:Hypotheticial protein n=1 Tax=Schistosoma japonicum TaxID=6182 RepID=C1L594_SCHJA|nr:hypotheticial protein [Schistosoma japonicum]CAX69872.1 hypotheticial protein [Schistosoma japonicum]
MLRNTLILLQIFILSSLSMIYVVKCGGEEETTTTTLPTTTSASIRSTVPTYFIMTVFSIHLIQRIIWKFMF